MRDLSDMTRFLRNPQNLVFTIIGAAVLIFLISVILGALGRKSNQDAGPPTSGGGPPSTSPPVQSTKKGVAILYDVSKSIPVGLADKFDSAVMAANRAVDSLISSNPIDSNIWEIPDSVSYPDGSFDVMVLIKMGKPRSESPFFEGETVEREELEEKLPSSRGDFQSEYTYITLAKAVGAEALEKENAEEMYLLIISDFQESKRVRPYTAAWADFSRKFDGKYNIEKKLISAGWKQSTNFQVKLIKLERG